MGEVHSGVHTPDRRSAHPLTLKVRRSGAAIDKGTRMSMAFLRDDAEGEMPRRNYGLPERDDPDYDRVAARAMLEAARVGETQLAERATGYYWGEPCLKPYVEVILTEAEKAGDDRLEQVARRFLR